LKRVGHFARTRHCDKFDVGYEALSALRIDVRFWAENVTFLTAKFPEI